MVCRSAFAVAEPRGAAFRRVPMMVCPFRSGARTLTDSATVSCMSCVVGVCGEIGKSQEPKTKKYCQEFFSSLDTVPSRIYIRLYSHTNYNTRHGPLLIAYRAVIRVFRRFAPYLSCTRVFTRRCGCGEWALAYKRKKRKPAPAVGTDYSIRNTASGAGPWAFELFIPIRAGPPARSAA